MRVVGCRSCDTTNEVRPSPPSVTPVWLTETRNEVVSDEPRAKPALSEAWNSYVRVPAALDVTFCTVNVGRSVPSCWPLTGETAVGVERVTEPIGRVGSVGPIGTWRVGVMAQPHAETAMDNRKSPGHV